MPEKRQSITTERKSLLSDRITLWRNTLQLFHKLNKPAPGFIGPFKQVGFSYIVERPVLTTDGKECSPDIIASGKTGWVILELTTGLKSKEINLDKYNLIKPSELKRYRLPEQTMAPDIICSRLESFEDGPYCKLIVKKNLLFENSCYMKNDELREVLSKSSGVDLSKLPEIPITILPEMVGKSRELRQALIDGVMQIFMPGSKGKTSNDLVIDGLERLYDLVGVTAITGLSNSVKNQMDILVNDFLEDYLELDTETKAYRAKEDFTPHQKKLEHIHLKLKEWAGLTIPQQTTLDSLREGH
jgi:hypothetical protein